MGPVHCQIQQEQVHRDEFHKLDEGQCLEAVAKCTTLGDQVIRWLSLDATCGHVHFEEFLN
jgi:hypothetical protein